MIRSAFMAFVWAASALCYSPGPAAASREVSSSLKLSKAETFLMSGYVRPSVGHLPLAPVKRRSTPPHLVSAPPLGRVAAATRAAVVEPADDFYVGASQIYPWKDGTLYRLYAAPEQISEIALQPGENLVSVAAGDTSRWVIGETNSGSASGRRTHVLVKPVAAGLRTNIVIATDRRLYHLDVVSTARTAMASISWTYPQDMVMGTFPPSVSPPEAAVAQAVAVESLNFDYLIAGDNVSWRPVRAFDDGHQVFIEFPPTLRDGEAPPLFIVGDNGSAELVNYRLKGRYYVVDRLFAAAELRLGSKHQKIVRIVRGDGSRRRGRAA